MLQYKKSLKLKIHIQDALNINFASKYCRKVIKSFAKKSLVNN